MLQRGPGDEHVALSAYERRQLKVIEQTLENEDPRSPGAERAGTGGAEWCPIWVALTVTWVWLALMSTVSGNVILVLLALAGGAASVAHMCRQRRGADPDG